jgi:hypothetical protein
MIVILLVLNGTIRTCNCQKASVGSVVPSKGFGMDAFALRSLSMIDL